MSSGCAFGIVSYLSYLGLIMMMGSGGGEGKTRHLAASGDGNTWEYLATPAAAKLYKLYITIQCTRVSQFARPAS